MTDNFVPTATAVYDDILRQHSVGLVSADEYKQRKSIIDAARQNAQVKIDKLAVKPAAVNTKPVKKQRTKLSFNDDADEDAATVSNTISDKLSPQPPPSISTANPSVDTTYLPDSNRDALLEAERQRLRDEWLAEQDRMKQSTMTITYSFYDGSSHRHKHDISRGATIDMFLRQIKPALKQKYADVAYKNAELMFVKNDTILPNNLTLYDLMTANRAGDKSAALADFSEHAYVPKVMLKSYYTRHKHVYPYSSYVTYESLVSNK